MYLGVLFLITVCFFCVLPFLYKCPNCGKRSNMIRISENIWVCWRCGQEW